MRRGSVTGIAGFAVLATAIATVTVLVADTAPAGASGLTRFESCGDMQAWVEDVQRAEERRFRSADDAAGAAESTVEEGVSADTSVAAPTAASDRGGSADRTNTVVEGVDEIDVVELLPGDRALVARNGTLSLVRLDDLTVLDSYDGLPVDARVSVGGGVVWVAGSMPDDRGATRTAVSRLVLDGDSLDADAEWTTPGWLVDARRTGDGLHILAVDQPTAAGDLPFEGGPVPCDQVWRPATVPTTPAATLLATLPAEGALEPAASAEVVGAGAAIHVTATAAYVTTESWDGEAETEVHRFDLDTLAPTGSGSVPGSVPGPFALSEHDGHLRVATNVQPRVGGPVASASGSVAVDIMPAPGAPGSGPLAEVFVLDLVGDLDVVGSTGRFGHDGESIHGIRFVGDVAYVVTFLQTDPFWVLDLSDPEAPETVGELEIPGFSGYLHPVDEAHVVGFGPDGSGNVAARLFDVADPTGPTLEDELELGHESPVVWDHHAYVGLDDGRFAVPVMEHPEARGERCLDDPVPLPRPIDPGIGDGSSSSPSMPEPGRRCEPVFTGGSTGVAVLAVDGDSLVLDDEHAVDRDGTFVAERVLPVSDGRWILVGYDRLVDPDGGELVLPM